MKKIIQLLIILFLFQNCENKMIPEKTSEDTIEKRELSDSSKSDEVIIIEGLYTGKNLFIKNAFGKDGIGYCVHQTRVNGKTTTDEINADMFMIDLVRLGLKIGDKINVEIFYAKDCTPHLKPLILNPGAINASNSVNKDEASFTMEGKYNYQNIFISNSVGPDGKGYGLKEIKVNGNTLNTEINLPTFQIDMESMHFKETDLIKIEFIYYPGYDPIILNPEALN